MLRIVTLRTSRKRCNASGRYHTNEDINNKRIIPIGITGLALTCGFGYFVHNRQMTEGRKEHFSQRYPDKTLHVTHQEVLIPNIMEKITRERECKTAYEEFNQCLEREIDPNRSENKDHTFLRKFLKITFGHACKEFQNAKHDCSRAAMYNEDLYYEAKEIFLLNRKKYMDAMVPLAMVDYVVESIQRGQKFYYSGQRTDFHEKTIEFFRRESIKYGTYDTYFDEDGNWISHRKELLEQANPRQSARDMQKQLREEISEMEELLVKQKQSNKLPNLPFKTINVLDNKGDDIPSDETTP